MLDKEINYIGVANWRYGADEYHTKTGSIVLDTSTVHTMDSEVSEVSEFETIVPKETIYIDKKVSKRWWEFWKPSVKTTKHYTEGVYKETKYHQVTLTVVFLDEEKPPLNLLLEKTLIEESLDEEQ